MSILFNKKIILIFLTVLIVSFVGNIMIVNAASPADAEMKALIKTNYPSVDFEGLGTTELEAMTITILKDKYNYSNGQINQVFLRNSPLPTDLPGGHTSGEWEEVERIEPQKKDFVPLAPIPGVTDAESAKDPSNFFNGMFRLGIMIAVFLAVIMIIAGGIAYMTTDSIDGKQTGKTMITSALLGLLLVLFSYILLNTINPDILNFRI